MEERVGERVVRAGGEEVVVRAEDGLGGAPVGDDEVAHLAQAEEQESVGAAVVGGEAGQGDVGGGADQVQVADEGEPWRRRRETAAPVMVDVRCLLASRSRIVVV